MMERPRETVEVRYSLQGFSLPFAPTTIDAEWYAKALHWLRGDNYSQHFYGPLLYGLVLHKRPTTIVEVGTERGFSALCMAKALLDGRLENSHVYTIDMVPHDERKNWHYYKHPETDPATGIQLARVDLVKEFEPVLLERITFLCGDSSQVLSEWNKDPIDFAFIDGAHSYDGVKADIDAMVPHLSADAMLVFDDYGPAQSLYRWRKWALLRVGYPGVRKAVDELFEGGGCVFHYPRTPDFDRVAILQRFCTE